jgi:hypothetical protein
MQFIDFISCAYDMITNYIATSRYRGSGPAADRDPRPLGRRGARRPLPLAEPGDGVLPYPGLKIVYPATAYDAKGLIKAAIRDDDPVLFFEHKWLYRRPHCARCSREDYVVPLGKARVHREGSDVTIVTYAAMVHKSARGGGDPGSGGRPLGGGPGPANPAPARRGRDRPRASRRRTASWWSTRTPAPAGSPARSRCGSTKRRSSGSTPRAPRHRGGRARPLLPPAGGLLPPQAEDVVKAVRYLAAY